MSTAAAASPASREPDLAGQPVVVIGGSAGIGLESTATVITGQAPDIAEAVMGERVPS
jgi:hypothetical protein